MLGLFTHLGSNANEIHSQRVWTYAVLIEMIISNILLHSDHFSCSANIHHHVCVRLTDLFGFLPGVKNDGFVAGF